MADEDQYDWRKGLKDEYESQAARRWGQALHDVFVNEVRRRGAGAAGGVLSALAPRAAAVVSKVSPLAGVATTAYGGTRAAIDHMPQSWQDKITDNVGGTMNQVAQRVGGGIDDSNYLAQQSRAAKMDDMGMMRRFTNTRPKFFAGSTAGSGTTSPSIEAGNDAAGAPPMQPQQQQQQQSPPVEQPTTDPFRAAIMGERNRLMGQAQPQVNALPADSNDAFRAAIQNEHDRLFNQARSNGVPAAQLDPSMGGHMLRRSLSAY